MSAMDDINDKPITREPMNEPLRWWQKRTVTISVALLGLALVIIIMTMNVAKYENHLATGDTVLLELAPVDPRGLMQGDYMALSYDIERKVFDALPPDAHDVEEDIKSEAELLALENTAIESKANSAAIKAGEFESEAAAFEAMQVEADARFAAQDEQWQQNFRKYDSRQGYVIVKIDDDNVGHFARLAESQPVTLAADEMAIQYRARDGSVKIATNAFFFQEGHAEAFEAAEYGLFRVNDKGEPLLTKMVDKNFAVIDPKVKADSTQKIE